MDIKFTVHPIESFENRYGIFPHRELLTDGIIIAGGAVRDWMAKHKPKDVDVFYKSGMKHKIGSPILKGLDLFDTSTYDLPEIHTVEMKFSNAKELLESFDFTVNQCAVYLDETGEPTIMVGEYTKSDISAKVLTYVGSLTGTHPVYHAKRIGKFIAKGYMISNEEVLEICKAVMDNEVGMPEDGDYDGPNGRLWYELLDESHIKGSLE